MPAQSIATPRSFAFIGMGDFSHTNASVLAQLRARFPHLHADVIDVGRLRIIPKASLPRMLLAVVGEFGLEPCRSRDKFYRHLLKTRHYFLRAKAALQRRLAQRAYAFSFQTQALFDASRAGTPHFIYTDHTHLENLKYAAPNGATVVSRGWAELERSAFHQASMVFTMSSNIARSLIAEYGCSPEKVACVYAGGNVCAPHSERFDDARFAAKNILFVGVDWERKGGPDLLAAFRMVRTVHPDARLTIIGCSPPISETGVRVLGRLPLAELAQHYRSASIFCVPTLNEPFGLVFVEALSHGLPVVATRLGAIPEIVVDDACGYLVAPGNARELAERLARLLSDPARCALFGAHGRRWVRERYCWEETGLKLAGHIERIVRSPGRCSHAVIPTETVGCGA